MSSRIHLGLFHIEFRKCFQKFVFGSFSKSRPPQIDVTSVFTAQSDAEAKYMIGAIHFLRTVSKMHFGETRSKGGLILIDDDGTSIGIHPRWAKVYAIGKKHEDVKVGQWILVAHGRWSRALKIENEKGIEEVRIIDEDDILLVSDKEPEDNRQQAGYINTGGMKQMTKMPGND